jgi:hypothetical protein
MPVIADYAEGSEVTIYLRSIEHTGLHHHGSKLQKGKKYQAKIMSDGEGGLGVRIPEKVNGQQFWWLLDPQDYEILK